jgi:hypothetical protein
MAHTRIAKLAPSPAFVIAVVLALAAAPASPVLQRRSAAEPVTIPIEYSARHVFVTVTINKSRPLSFVLDTGANVAIVRTDVAKELGLELEGTVRVGGAGIGTQAGSRVKNAKWSLVGLDGFSQPVTLALPLPELAAAMGRPIDGIIGGEFIKQFVVELDYQAERIRLHRPGAFTYTGSGEALPIEFVNVVHPVVTATVSAGGRALERRFMFDIGSGGALVLHSPFVAEQHLPEPGATTIRVIGSAGAGGRIAGQLGRVESLKIGSFTIASPITIFSQDRAGAFANADLAGNIGGQIAMRFKLFLDYGRRRIIFEPSSAFGQPFDRAFSGVALRGSGPGYRTLTVLDVLENSPATDAGIAVGDVLESVDGVPVDRLTLPAINDMFEKPVAYALTLRRGTRTFTATLTPRRMI